MQNGNSRSKNMSFTKKWVEYMQMNFSSIKNLDSKNRNDEM